MFAQYVGGICFGAGLITASVILKWAFQVGFCG